jgi:hypothetical protein
VTAVRLPPLAKTENRQERFVDSPLLFGRHPADQVSQAADVNGTHLLDEDFRMLAKYVYLWPERSKPGAARRRRYQHNRPRQKLISLDHYAKTLTLLLMALSPGHPDLVDVTPEHAGSP